MRPSHKQGLKRKARKQRQKAKVNKIIKNN